ncbi:MAG: hypothetical protein NZ928_03055 [Endomicrobia bacterium]|nr:hypothetical protein [Endomicrobiia bacterium]
MKKMIFEGKQAKNSFVARRQLSNPEISKKCRLELYFWKTKNSILRLSNNIF